MWDLASRLLLITATLVVVVVATAMVEAVRSLFRALQASDLATRLRSVITATLVVVAIAMVEVESPRCHVPQVQAPANRPRILMTILMEAMETMAGQSPSHSLRAWDQASRLLFHMAMLVAVVAVLPPYLAR